MRRKSAKAAKLERERIRKEKLEKAIEDRKAASLKINGHVNGTLDGTCDVPAEQKLLNGVANGGMTKDLSDERRKDSDSDETLTETSEEEMIP